MICSALVLAGHALLSQTPPLDPAIAYMGRIAGKWTAVAHAGKSAFKCRFEFEWNRDHRGIHGEADIAIDTPQPMHSYTVIGYDQNAKAAYYVDAHDSDTLYAGHVYLEGGKLVFRFGNYGKGEGQFVSTEWFVDDDHYVSEIRQAAKANGPPMIRVELTRLK